MTTKNFLLGIDVSTSGAKALLIGGAGTRKTGEVVASATTPLSISYPHPLWSEQDPYEWWSAVVNSIRTVLSQVGIAGEQIQAIGLTGQMHGLVLLDRNNRVLRPAILWNDQRTAAQCAQITQQIGFDRLLSITGNQALTGFTAPKILWVRQNEPQIYAKIAHVLLPKDYIRFRLTDDYAVDKADGAGMLLFDLRQRDFSADLLNELQIPGEWMPRSYEGPQVTGVLSRQVAYETILQEGTPVVAGGGDQAAQAVGVGAVEPGIVALTLGTSGVVFASTPEPLIEPQGRLHAFCHAVPDLWHFMGVMLSGAGSLHWHRDTVAPYLSYDDLLQPAEEIPPGSEGLFFLPYLAGERTPHPDPLARGAFIGLTLRHTRAHMTRAVLEGVAFGLRDCMELLRSAGLGEIRQVRVSGGGAKSRLWRQILSDVFDASLTTVTTTEGAAYGAALLAGVGSGVWDTVQDACRQVVQTLETTLPLPDAVDAYKAAYERYRKLYPTLKPIFDDIASAAGGAQD